jgi:catechol 2,3-dioxygenase-like lactoylglutathione lyase family enzyme
MNVSHVGLRVRDLDVSKRFYEALGFTEAKRLKIPDKVAAGLLPLTPPIGFEAVYLHNDGFVLQLLTFSGHPRLTNLSAPWSAPVSRTCRSPSTTWPRRKRRCGPQAGPSSQTPAGDSLAWPATRRDS